MQLDEIFVVRCLHFARLLRGQRSVRLDDLKRAVVSDKFRTARDQPLRGGRIMDADFFGVSADHKCEQRES